MSYVILPVLGQSNGYGQGDEIYEVAYDHYRLGPNGHIQNMKGPDGMLLPQNVNAAGDYDNFSVGVRGGSGPGGGAYGWEARLCDLLRDEGLTDTILVVNGSVNGCSAQRFTDTATVGYPLTLGADDYLSHATMRIEYCLRATGATAILPAVFWQGETEAADPPNPAGELPSDWGPAVTIMCDYLASRFTITTTSGIKFLITQLYNGGPEGAPNYTLTGWADMRAAQAAFVAGRADSVLVECPVPPSPRALHPPTTTILALAELYAAQYVSSLGL